MLKSVSFCTNFVEFHDDEIHGEGSRARGISGKVIDNLGHVEDGQDFDMSSGRS